MAGQDFDKDLFIVLVGSGKTTLENFVANVEDYIFGDRDEREATLLVPVLPQMSDSLGQVLIDWAVTENDEGEINYPVRVFKDAQVGHKVVAKAKEVISVTDDDRVYMDSAEIERAMTELVKYQKEGNEVVVVVLYDEEKDVRLVGELKNYQSVPVLNVDGMIDDFPGFKTTEEILKEERLREEFETKEAIRIAAEKEQEKAQKDAESPLKAPRKATAPRTRKTAAKAPEDTPLTDKPARAPRKKAAAKVEKALEEHPGGLDEFKQPEPEYKVGDVVEVGGIPFVKHSELPSELEPVKVLDTSSSTDTASVDVWADVARAQGTVDNGEVTHYAVKKTNLIALGEGIKAMSEAHAKTIDALLEIIEGK